LPVGSADSVMLSLGIAGLLGTRGQRNGEHSQPLSPAGLPSDLAAPHNDLYIRVLLSATPLTPSTPAGDWP
jgi:hypothetical protein